MDNHTLNFSRRQMLQTMSGGFGFMAFAGLSAMAAKLTGVKKSSQYAHKSGNVRVINSGAGRKAYTDVDVAASIRRQANKVNNLSMYFKNPCYLSEKLTFYTF